MGSYSNDQGLDAHNKGFAIVFFVGFVNSKEMEVVKEDSAYQFSGIEPSAPQAYVGISEIRNTVKPVKFCIFLEGAFSFYKALASSQVDTRI